MVNINAKPGCLREIDRLNVFDGIIKMYEDKPESVVLEYPIWMKFAGEAGIDEGGVQRDMYTAFWDDCYSLLFEGATTLVPMVHPQIDLSQFVTIGRVISHGYLATGILPDRIALPVLISAVRGLDVTIPEHILLEAFVDFVSATERVTLRSAIDALSFSPSLTDRLIDVLSRFGCRKMPTPSTLHGMIIQAARYEFCVKPAAALSLLHSGVPPVHQSFWKEKSASDIYALHCKHVATPEKVIALLQSDHCTQAQECVYKYLVTMLGNMSLSEIRLFLRFVTGCSICITPKIAVTYNSLDGAARRPISHTCDVTLELSVFYKNYVDFCNEFKTFLNSTKEDFCWRIDAL